MVWEVWVAAVVVSFLVLEVPALRNAKKGDTLSEQLRLWFHTGTHRGRIVWLIFSTLFFVAWFIPHIALPSGSLF